jgi:hypothetical protein
VWPTIGILRQAPSRLPGLNHAWSAQQARDLFHAPMVPIDTGRLRWRHAESLVNAGEAVVHGVSRDRAFVVDQVLAECVRQRCEAGQSHSHCDVLAFSETCPYRLFVWRTADHLSLGCNALRRRVWARSNVRCLECSCPHWCGFPARARSFAKTGFRTNRLPTGPTDSKDTGDSSRPSRSASAPKGSAWDSSAGKIPGPTYSMARAASRARTGTCVPSAQTTKGGSAPRWVMPRTWRRKQPRRRRAWRRVIAIVLGSPSGRSSAVAGDPRRGPRSGAGDGSRATS